MVKKHQKSLLGFDHKKKSVSCPAGGQNCGQSGGRNFFSLPFFGGGGVGVGKYCQFCLGGGEGK